MVGYHKPIFSAIDLETNRQKYHVRVTIYMINIEIAIILVKLFKTRQIQINDMVLGRVWVQTVYSFLHDTRGGYVYG